MATSSVSWMQDSDAFPRLSEPDSQGVGLLVQKVTGHDGEELRRDWWWPLSAEEAVTGLRLSDQAYATLGALRASLGEGACANAVWMDATTLYRARRLLADDPAAGREVFDALALLDLDTFVRNFLLYDQIYAIRNDATDEWGDMRPLNESMGEPVFLTLLPDGTPESAVEDLFHSLFFKARSWVTEATSDSGKPVMANQFAAWRASAQQIYGTVPDQRTEIRLVQDWGSVAEYVSRLVTSSDKRPIASVMWAADEESQHKLIADATVRAVFNANLAQALDLSYSPAAARLPTVAAYDMARACAAVEALVVGLRDLRRERLQGLARVHREVVAAPVWAAILLSRAGRTSDLWPALVALRQESAPLRARRAALDEELNGNGEEKALAELREALRADSVNLWAAWGGTLGTVAVGVVASALTGGPWGYGFVAGVAAMIGAEFLTDQPEKLRARLLKPRQTQITHLGTQVQGLRNSLPKAQSLWGINDAAMRHHVEAHTRMESMGWL